MRWWMSILCVFLLAGCTMVSERIELGNQNYPSVPTDIYLIPMEGVSVEFASIAQEIESRYKLATKVLTTMGRETSMFNTEHRQYSANRIAQRAHEIIAAIKRPEEQPFILVLTPYDINTEDFQLRFLFAAHFKEIAHFNGVSVISTARIDPVNYGLPRDNKLRDDRLMKLINKAIGQQVLHIPISSDSKSAMYGPILGLDDLDSMSSALNK